MPWNPALYNQFKSIRYQPFFDLMNLVSQDGLKKGVDIGCGTGEQTHILSKQFPQAHFLGIDTSNEMLSESHRFVNPSLNFQNMSIEDFVAQEAVWDLIFSNAALQWSDQHEELFPKLISSLADGGQFAVQMPVQNENLLNQILLTLVQEKPFVDFLKHYKRESPVLGMDAYVQLMFQSGLKDIQVIQKVYPIIADSAEVLFDFISGSALIPYMYKLTTTEQALFASTYKSRIEEAFRQFPAIYSFKRLLIYGRKSDS